MCEVSDWDSLEFWRTGEWQAIEERLDDLDKEERFNGGQGYNPARQDLFAAMDKTPLKEVKVVIFGQDPYPETKFCTGIAFSIPEGYRKFPPTLVNIFKEYSDDLGLTTPRTGNLEKWCEQGVFLWNVCPTCATGKPGSHHNWWEWQELNKEIIKVLNKKRIVFVFLGAWARQYENLVDHENNKVIATSHPSPLGALKGTNPFFGSRIFSRINDALNELDKDPIDWKLPGSKTLEKR